MILEETFIERLQAVRHRVATACAASGRAVEDIRILPVTKTHGPWAAEYAVRAGLLAVGENRVQEAFDKRQKCTEPARWTLIGNLQSNKARQAVETFDAIHSVDRIKIVKALAKHAEAIGKEVGILLQINAGKDPAKFGAEPEAAEALLRCALALPALKVQGLMTIAPLSDNPDIARAAFANLRVIRDRLQEATGHALPELSMGMSGDLEVAIAEGSTCIRVGSALYGERG